MKRALLIIGLAIIACGLTSVPAHADDSRPSYIEITELAENIYKLQMKTSYTVPFNQPRVIFPQDCAPAADPNLRKPMQGAAFKRAGGKFYQCSGSLSGKTVFIKYPGYTPPASMMMKLILRTGETHTVILGPRQTTWQIPAAETKSRVAVDYMRLGVYHIWAGNDHLLFLVCLLWIAGGFSRILTTITGFTLAHSVTLALSALDVIQIPVPPVEAVIALSVVFLATEIAKDRQGTLTWRYPIVVSSVFGLLHGLGFAAVLNEIGLPQTELVIGLLFFNVGVEIGQVLFAVAVAAGFFALKRFASRSKVSALQDRMQTILSYSVGSIASFWLIDRTINFLG